MNQQNSTCISQLLSPWQPYLASTLADALDTLITSHPCEARTISSYTNYATLQCTSRTPHAPFSFCLIGNFLSLPLSHILCSRCFTLQPDRESDHKSTCRTQHTLLIIFCFCALMMFRTLDSHNSKVVRHSVHSLWNLMIRMIGSLGAFLMFICVTHMCQLVHRYPLQSSRLIFSFVKTSAPPLTCCI